jgi:multidrug efflux pump
VTVTQYRERTESIDVVARAVAPERLSVEGLEAINLRTGNGGVVSLAQLATLHFELEEPILWRRNRDTVLTVRGDIVDGVQPPDVSKQIEPLLQPIKDALPYGYRIETGGSIEESAKANGALVAVFPVMAVVMLGLLMIQLQSFSRLALVFVTAPLGLIGATGALLVAGTPFGFVALLGLIALAGMIMRNTVILVDQIEQDIAAGHDTWSAIREATVRRFRPITLTAAAAVLAMIPLTRSILWGPMAYAIMGGLVVATILTVVFVPALYAAWFRVKRAAPQPATLSVSPAAPQPVT